MPRKKHPAEDVPLIPFDEFKETVEKMLAESKTDNDEKLAQMMASNKAHREAKSRKSK